MTAAAEKAVEAGPRRVLGWGGALLVMGLAIVGIGSPTEGGPLALAGLLVTIYGIHRFGRLGPDDVDPDGEGTLAGDLVVAGVAAMVAGGAFVIGASGNWAAYTVMGAGAVAIGWGQRQRARVAARPAPEREAEKAPTKARSRRRRRPRPDDENESSP